MPSSNIYSKYYLEQAGYGVGNVYHGTRVQRGYGIGGFFSSLFRSATPLLKQGALAAGKALLRTSKDIIGDVIEGKSIKESAQQRFQQTGKDLMSRAVRHLQSQTGSGPATFKRKNLIPLLHIEKRKKKKRKIAHKDILS